MLTGQVIKFLTHPWSKTVLSRKFLKRTFNLQLCSHLRQYLQEVTLNLPWTYHRWYRNLLKVKSL